MHENWISQNFKALSEKLVTEYTKAGREVHFMNKQEFEAWLAFSKKTAWKDFAETVDGGQELLDLAVAAMK